METECNDGGTLFPDVAGREAVVRFNADSVTSNGGVLLLERADRRASLLSRFAACFRDHRDRERIEHTVRQLVTQRVFGLCLGYEDVSDHDAVGKDPLLVGAIVRMSARRIWISMSSSWPWRVLFEACARRLLAPALVT